MKYELRKFAVFSLVLPLLVACNEKLTADYLMQHPAILKNQIEHCDSLQSKIPDQVAHCNMVAQVAKIVSSVLDEQQQNPEQFGQQVLKAEIAAVQAEKNLNQAEHALASLKQANASAAALQAAQDKFIRAEQLYRQYRNEVKTMLGVLSINSPE